MNHKDALRRFDASILPLPPSTRSFMEEKVGKNATVGEVENAVAGAVWRSNQHVQRRVRAAVARFLAMPESVTPRTLVADVIIERSGTWRCASQT